MIAGEKRRAGKLVVTLCSKLYDKLILLDGNVYNAAETNLAWSTRLQAIKACQQLAQRPTVIQRCTGVSRSSSLYAVGFSTLGQSSAGCNDEYTALPQQQTWEVLTNRRG